MNYGLQYPIVVDVAQTEAFGNWLAGLRDRRAVARIASRIALIERGALGDVKALGGGLSEFRIDYGPGYRLYAAQRGAHPALRWRQAKARCGHQAGTRDACGTGVGQWR